MTTITREPVPSHDLQSADVIKRLKLNDYVLIDEIASRFYAKILQVLDSDIPTIKDWSKRDEKLKWVLHAQVELLGPLYVCEELIDKLASADEEKNGVLFRELVYEFFFLSQDIILIFSLDLEYPTWNLIDFLDPNTYFGLRDTSSSLVNKFDDIPYHARANSSALLHKLSEKLIAKGVEERSIEVADISLAEFLHWVQKYKRLINSFYEAETGAEALYAFQRVTVTAIHLLGPSLTLKLLLKPMSNNFQLTDKRRPKP